MHYYNISEVFSSSWELFKKHWVLLVLSVLFIEATCNLLLFMFGPGITLMTFLTDVINHWGDKDALKEVLERSQLQTLQYSLQKGTFLISLLKTTLYMGLFKQIMDRMYGRNAGGFSTDGWKMPADQYLKAVISQFIISHLCFAGALFCIIPGLYVYARLQFATYRILEDPKVSFGEAFSYSWKLTRRYAWTQVGINLLICLIGMGGFLLCCVGSLFTSPLCLIIPVACYKVLSTTRTDEGRTAIQS